MEAPARAPGSDRVPRPSTPSPGRRRPSVALTLVVVASLIAAGSYGLRSLLAPNRPDPATRDELTAALPVADGAVIDRLIVASEEALEARPNAPGFTRLARLLLMRANAIGDLLLYERAQTALTAAAGLAPRYLDTTMLQAQLDLTLHRFSRALTGAQAILRAEPSSAEARAIVGDALVALGRYDEAHAVFEGLSRELPDASGLLTRRAHLAFLTGDTAQAEQLAARATEVASGEGLPPESLAFYHLREGHLQLALGRPTLAGAAFARAIALDGRSHAALAGAAAADAAAGDLEGAAARYARAIAITPDHEYLAAAGDVEAARGDHRAAEELWARSVGAAKVSPLERHLSARPLALFYADHDRDLAAAVGLAEREYGQRPDAYSADVYAWVLYHVGRYDEARRLSDEARAGTPEVRFLYHAGMISAALGEADRARDELTRALTISPLFDPRQAPRARRMLEQLGAG